MADFKVQPTVNGRAVAEKDIQNATVSTFINATDRLAVVDNSGTPTLKYFVFSTLQSQLQTAYNFVYGRLTQSQNWTGNNAFDSAVASGTALSTSRNQAVTTGPVFSVLEDHASSAQPVVKVTGDGTGALIQFFDTATKVFEILDGGTVQVYNIIKALTSSGIRLEDDGGNLGILIEDNGLVVVGGNGMQFRSSNIAHGMTDFVSTSTYGQIIPGTGTFGGLSIEGFTDTDGISPLGFAAYFGADPTDTLPAFNFLAQKKNGTGAQALAATETVLAVDNYTTRIFTILGGGNIGSGTNLPESQMHVVATSLSSSRGVLVGQHSTDAGAAINFMRKSRGTQASPSTVANADFIGAFGFQVYDGTAYRQTAAIAAKVNGTVASNSIPTDLIFATGVSNDPSLGNERMRINSIGDVGIAVAPIGGHANYVSLFMGGSAQLMALRAGGAMHISENAYYDGAWKRRITAATSLYIQSVGAHMFYSAASGTAGVAFSWTENVRIQADGRVGIGTATPAGTETNSRFTVEDSDATAHYIAVINTGAGQVGVALRRTGGTVSNWILYTAAGVNNFNIYGGTAGSNKLTIGADGSLTVPYIGATVLAGTAVHTSAGGTLTKATSSRRYKRNIKPADSNLALKWLRELQPVVYQAKQHFVGAELVDYTAKEKSDQYMGLLAEDVYALSGTHFVGLDEGGEPETLHYDRLAASLLVMGWQSHEREIAELKREIAELKKH